jgi:hypothetical protein
VRRNLLFGGAADPGTRTTAQTLAALDEKDQADRTAAAMPKERTYVLSRVAPGSPSGK